jgi:hypothetical protein
LILISTPESLALRLALQNVANRDGQCDEVKSMKVRGGQSQKRREQVEWVNMTPLPELHVPSLDGIGWLAGYLL